jgi:hypothetical protein
MNNMHEQTFQVGMAVMVAKDSPNGPYSTFFEDDGETGYFYALDLRHSDPMILDAVHIYNVTNVADRDRPSTLSIVWSEDGSKCALSINGYPHAAFDFAAQRGYCRSNFPNFPNPTEGGWLQSNHRWSDEAVAWLKGKETI